MDQEMYNLVSAISLGLTFVTAFAGLIVSISANRRAAMAAKESNRIAKESNTIARNSNTIADQSNNVADRSNDIAQHAGYLGTVTASRDKWQKDMREATALYFTSLSRICNESEKDINQALVDFWHYHHLVSLYMSMEDNKLIYDKMEMIHQKVEIVMNSVASNQSHTPAEENAVREARSFILDALQESLSPMLNKLIYAEWQKTKNEASQNMSGNIMATPL